MKIFAGVHTIQLYVSFVSVTNVVGMTSVVNRVTGGEYYVGCILCYGTIYSSE